LGVEKDEVEALRLFRVAAEKEHIRAQTKLADFLLQGKGCEKSPHEAFKWYMLASDQGSMAAKFALGGLYERGEGCEQSWRRAVQFYEAAALGGDNSASDRLISIIANTTMMETIFDCGYARLCSVMLPKLLNFVHA
jgi:TPR repeat protein